MDKVAHVSIIRAAMTNRLTQRGILHRVLTSGDGEACQLCMMEVMAFACSVVPVYKVWAAYGSEHDTVQFWGGNMDLQVSAGRGCPESCAGCPCSETPYQKDTVIHRRSGRREGLFDLDQ